MIIDLGKIPEGSVQYERWYRLNRGAFRNFVIVAAGAALATTFATAATAGSHLLVVAGAVASWISFEGIKKSSSYVSLTQEIGRILDEASSLDLSSVGRTAGFSLRRIHEFVVSNKKILSKLLGDSKEMEWLGNALRKIQAVRPMSIMANLDYDLENAVSSTLMTEKARIDANSRLGVPIFSGRISKTILVSFERQWFLASGIMNNRLEPVIAQTVGDETGRDKLWQIIRDQKLGGRKFYVLISRESYNLWFSLLKR